MPIIGVPKRILEARLERNWDEESFQELCFDYGLELDEVTSEKEQKEKELAKAVEGEALSEELVYRVELPANRYDLLCAEGLCRALRVFQSQSKVPNYRLAPGPAKERLIIKPETAAIRPHAVAAVLRNVSLTPDAYASFIDLQDKLHQNLCRKRSLVAIGTHDLDSIKGPFVYSAEDPKSLRFRALKEAEEASAAELMAKYESPGHALRPYVPIIKDAPRYPVIRDANGVVLSMPPIINGEHSKITLNTRNIFIECTATDLTKAKLVLDTLVCLFSEYCAEPFEIEAVEVEAVDGRKMMYPTLARREESVSVSELNGRVGVELSGETIAELLGRMCLESRVEGDNVVVAVPPTRQDILHPCDVMEDVAVAYGFNNLVPSLPSAPTIAQPNTLNKLTEAIRLEAMACGYTECLTFALLSREEAATKLRHNLSELDTRAVHIGNPKTAEFQVGRTSLLPGILKTLAANRKLPLPLKVFECQDVILQDAAKDVGARNERRLAAIYYDRSPAFERIHGFLDRILNQLKSPPHSLKPVDDPTFFPGRACEVVVEGLGSVGKLGTLHPDVIQAFDLTCPATALEVNVEPFL